MLAETIKQTGLFREIYKAYKINPDNMTAGGATGAAGAEPGAELSTAIGGGGGGAEGGLGTDFTAPLETPETGAEVGAEAGTETEAGAETETAPEETLAERSKRYMDKRRSNITETINKSIAEIDKILKD
jgi:hypothetical protein